MRMKEICEKTGLTDRAVRLYIDSGLLSPERSTNYSGYTSIHFNETDLEKLEMIAMLRRAGFGISDIREMQDDPSCISEKIQSRCSDIERNMKEHSKILSGKRKYLIAATVGIILSAALLICMPAHLTDKIRLLAFTDYRHSFLFDLFGSTNGNASSVIWLLMLCLPLVISFIFCLTALLRSFREPKDCQI